MIEFRKTDKFVEYRNWHFADIVEIYYDNILVGAKYIDNCKKNPVWYRIFATLTEIEQCESKFGYGWFLDDCAYYIDPADGNLTLEQIENELIPNVCKWIYHDSFFYIGA